MSTPIRRLKRLSLAILVCLAAVVPPGFVSSCSARPSATLETVTFGTLAPNEIAGLIYVAEDKGLFARNGLDVVVKPYDTGVTVTDALLKGEIDIGLSAELPFLNKALAGEDVSIIGVVDRFSYFYLFGRKDRGIDGIAALKGKRIGSSRGTITDFYLGRFLELNGMSIKDITLVDVPPAELADAIAKGTVDAIVAWSLFAQQIRTQMGAQVTEWPVQAGQASFGVLSARKSWIGGHQKTIERFLKSLSEAERSVVNRPDDAKAIIRRQMNYDEASVQTAWPEHDFGLSLDQAVIVAMEDETRWMISNGLTSAKTVPNLLDFIYAEGLKSVKPDAVRISGR